jgi:hypothetical protein
MSMRRMFASILLMCALAVSIAGQSQISVDLRAAERAMTDVSPRVNAYAERLAHSNLHGVRLP